MNKNILPCFRKNPARIFMLTENRKKYNISRVCKRNFHQMINHGGDGGGGGDPFFIMILMIGAVACFLRKN